MWWAGCCQASYPVPVTGLVSNGIKISTVSNISKVTSLIEIEFHMEASIGKVYESLFEWLWSFDQDQYGCHAHICIWSSI